VTEERSSQQVAKSASRIALYMMREEIRDGRGQADVGAAGPASLQHTHDFFVISSCRVDVGFKEAETAAASGGEETATLTLSGKKVPSRIFPADVQKARDILARHGVDVYGRANNATTEKGKTHMQYQGKVTLDAFLLNTRGLKRTEISNMKTVYAVVEAAKEMGVTSETLLATAEKPQAIVESSLKKLLEAKVVLKTGVTLSRFVASSHASCWLLKSFKLKRVKHKETVPATEAGQAERSRVSASAEALDWDGVEEINFSAKPWLRVDGSLNRRVLDRLLGAVLGHVMQCPSQSAAKVADRFSPALQPAHCLDLIDLLRELGCVSVLAVRRSSPKSGAGGVFARREDIKLEEPTLLDAPAHLLVEAAVDAVTTLGQFIGDKQYSMDFACACPCHPDKKAQL